jgi:hypothetical protein
MHAMYHGVMRALARRCLPLLLIGALVCAYAPDAAPCVTAVNIAPSEASSGDAGWSAEPTAPAPLWSIGPAPVAVGTPLTDAELLSRRHLDRRCLSAARAPLSAIVGSPPRPRAFLSPLLI